MNQTAHSILAHATKKIPHITIKHLVDGLLAGSYNSIFRGQGIEFSEIRNYRAGDDIRAIDWNVTARFNEPYIKEFIEERDLHIYFVLDVSGSTAFGTNTSKKNKSLELIASLMFTALQNNDKIGCYLITDTIEKGIPARGGKKHLMYTLDAITNHTPKSTLTSLEKPLAQISKSIKRKSTIFVVSDFMDQNPQYIKPLKVMRKKHDVIAIKITDIHEQQIPDIGLIELEDEETGEQILVDTSDPQFQQNYTKLMDTAQQKLDESLKSIRVDTIPIHTDQNYQIALKKFFQKRRKRGNRR